MHSESWALGGEESDRMNPSTSILTLGAEQNSLRVRAIEPRLGYRGSLMHPGRVSGASQGFFCPAYKSMRRLRALAMPPSVGISVSKRCARGDVTCVKVATTYCIVTYAGLLISILAPHLIHIC